MLPAGLHRLDVTLALLGPGALLLTWLLLPATGNEGAHADDRLDASGVVAELVGYEIEASDRARRLGRDATAQVRLHAAPVAGEAAVLWSPSQQQDSWWLAPARPAVTLRRVQPRDPQRVRWTSLRPWRDGASATLKIPCGEPRWRLTPRQLPELHGWGIDVEDRTDPDAATLVSPWHVTAQATTPGGEGLWLAQDAESRASARLGIWSTPAPLPPPPVTPCFEDGSHQGEDSPLEDLGALQLLEGDILAFGRTRFLVSLPEAREAATLRLLHVRDPGAPWYFRGSGAADVYHPNRRALWDVPSCDEEDGELNLRLRGGSADSQADTLPAAELARRDRLQQRRMDRAASHAGVPRELPAVEAESVGAQAAPAVLALCTLDQGTALRLRLHPPAETQQRGRRPGPPPSLRVETAGREQVLEVGEHTWSLLDSDTGRADSEVLLSLGGNLLRVAPAAGQRVGQRTRLGIVLYLSWVLLVAAVPLTLARLARRRFAAAQPAAWHEDLAWPIELGAATLQQLAGIALAVLLLIGTAYHLRLAVHPQLAGKPDYLQAFLQVVLLLGPLIAAAAGFAAGGLDLQRRLAWASLGAALALSAGAAWWALDAATLPACLWLTDLRSAAGTPSLGLPLAGAAGALFVTAIALVALPGRGFQGIGRALVRLGHRILQWPEPAVLVLLVGGLTLGVLRRSALALELALLAAVALYGAARWSFVREGQTSAAVGHRQLASRLSSAAGLLVLVFLGLFFFVEAHLPLWLSVVLTVSGLAVLEGTRRRIRRQHLDTLGRVLTVWLFVLILGGLLATALFRDLGSVAAWMPALLAGAFLWLVRPEEAGQRREETQQATVHVLLALGAGLLLLGSLDVLAAMVEQLPETPMFERPRQRIELARDISYITPGEWITEVRWLASGRGATFQWVPNINSDVAVFGLAAGFGFGHAALASLILLGAALACGAAADQALREARHRGHPASGDSTTGSRDRLTPALGRALGLLLGMVAVLLIAQWLVHLATGVVLHLPITGLVFPWLSHGNTTHLLLAAVMLLPLAALTALQEGRGLPS